MFAFKCLLINLIKRELQPNHRLGTEFSERAKVKAGVSGIFHSDELPKYGITEKEVSIVLSTVTQNFLYIVIASGGAVILKRNGKVGTIAAGEEGKTVAFSGELKPDDIVILETGDFSKKIPIKKLTQVIDNLEVSEISENLAPIIHEESQGTEAAIILQYKNIKKIEEEGAVKEDIASNQEEGEEQKQVMSIGAKIRLPKISFPINFEGATKKKALILAIVFLGILLLGSIFFERSRQEQAKRAQILSEIIEPNQKGYDEAVALISLNKGLALEEFEEIMNNLRSEFPGMIDDYEFVIAREEKKMIYFPFE